MGKGYYLDGIFAYHYIRYRPDIVHLYEIFFSKFIIHSFIPYREQMVGDDSRNWLRWNEA